MAIRTGIAEAQGENVVIMDADATYPVPAIAEMVELLDENDLVRGIRSSENREHAGGQPVRQLALQQAARAQPRARGERPPQRASTGSAARRPCGWEPRRRGFDIETEIGIKARARGLRVAEVPISYLPRVGEKKLSPWSDGFRILGRVIVLLLIYNPWVTFIIPGLLLMAVTVTGAIWLSQGDGRHLLPRASASTASSSPRSACSPPSSW